jgi:aspartyl-tRNA(Asn)/glutamyl-tRNA(Gln) amidotransferase subunit A
LAKRDGTEAMTGSARMTSPFAPISELARDIRERRLSPIAITEKCLGRIEALNPTLNAFITITTDLAREQAAQAEVEIAAGHWRGPLHGIPVAVKDFYDTAGIRTTAGFRQFEHRVPDEDAEMVQRLREAGAILVGKTNMHRLGMGTTSLESDFGPVVNPWNTNHVAGGSSGGSCVAVAAGLCFATVDTDAVGSGRLPAAICGVTCHKPTFGTLSGTGILAGEKAEPDILMLSHVCVTARSADDVSLVFETLTGARDASVDAGGDASRAPVSIRRVGVVANCKASDEIRAAFERVVSTLAAMEIETRDVMVPFDSATFDISRIDADRAAIDASLFADVDAIVLPTLTAPAPTVENARTLGDLGVAPDNTFFCNYYGIPATNVAAGFDGNGVPLGVQFVGPHGADNRVLALARSYQQSTGWRYVPPPGVDVRSS